MIDSRRREQIYAAARRRHQFSGTCANPDCGRVIFVYGYLAYQKQRNMAERGFVCCSVSCGKKVSWRQKKAANTTNTNPADTSGGGR